MGIDVSGAKRLWIRRSSQLRSPSMIKKYRNITRFLQCLGNIGGIFENFYGSAKNNSFFLPVICKEEEFLQKKR